MNIVRFIVFSILFIAPPLDIFSQEEASWYRNLPQKAAILENGSSMKIGDKNYRVYNAFSPIAPAGGERVIDFAGTFNYYMWIFKKQSGVFTTAKIDMELNIYYYDDNAQAFISPNGSIFEETEEYSGHCWQRWKISHKLCANQRKAWNFNGNRMVLSVLSVLSVVNFCISYLC
jgi:hypothetical protein